MTKAKERTTIDALLADRARFEAWLDQLAAKAGQVPAHVATRVKADYESRLTQVVDELASRAGELRDQTGSFESRIVELDTDLTGKRDARAEDELRAMVGEYADDEWASRRAVHDDAISTLESERAEREADLHRVRDLLAQTTRPSRALMAISEAEIPDEPTAVFGQGDGSGAVQDQVAAPDEQTFDLAEEEPKPDRDLELLDEAEPAPPAATVASKPEPPAEKKPSPFDEIAFLKTVVGRATPLGVARTPAASIAQVTEKRASGAAPAVSPPQSPPAPERPSRRSSIPSFDPPPLADAAPSVNAERPPAGPALSAETPPGGMSSFRASIGGGTEMARSLKCQECGSMNYPTEWYCEKCGGELAAF